MCDHANCDCDPSSVYANLTLQQIIGRIPHAPANHLRYFAECVLRTCQCPHDPGCECNPSLIYTGTDAEVKDCLGRVMPLHNQAKVNRHLTYVAATRPHIVLNNTSLMCSCIQYLSTPHAIDLFAQRKIDSYIVFKVVWYQRIDLLSFILTQWNIKPNDEIDSLLLTAASRGYTEVFEKVYTSAVPVKFRSNKVHTNIRTCIEITLPHLLCAFEQYSSY